MIIHLKQRNDPMENIASAQAGSPSPQKASRMATILSLVSSIVINVVLPVFIYLVLTTRFHTSDFLALVISAVPSMLESIAGVARRKRIDLLAGFVLGSIVISLILIALGGSPKLYLIRESFFTSAFGLAYLISLPFKKPLAFYISRYFATGNHPENIPWFDSLWQYQQFRHTMRVITVVWGIGLLVEAAIRACLVIALSTVQFLIVSPFILYGIIGALMIWMFLYSQQGRKKGEELRQRMEADPHASPS
jgi:uncharacterized membrane protein YvlD (DUF360 family)